jgi:uncharacterized metal-binding protein YceD (DUF177 family)
VKALRTFDIQIFNLAFGDHTFEFEIDETLFEAFDNDIVKKGRLKAAIELRRSEALIEMNFQIEGSVELECDRSLELFDYPLNFEKRMLYKLGDIEEELSEDVLVISRDSQTINVASLIFEFIGVEIPMKKLHPRFQVEEENLDDDDEGMLIFSSASKTEQEENPEPDERWSALKNLKNKD